MKEKELDLTLANIAEQNYLEKNPTVNKENKVDIAKLLKQLNIESIQELEAPNTLEDKRKADIIQLEQFYEKSVQSEKIKKRRVLGEMFAGKNVEKKRIQTAAKVIGGFILIGALAKGAHTYNVLDHYYQTLDSQVQEELTKEEFSNYQENKPSWIEVYQDVKDAKKELKETGNYNLLGKNISGSDQGYSSFVDGDIVSQSNLEEDAIRMATSEKIEEYQGKGK